MVYFEKELKEKMYNIIKWQTKEILPDLNINKILDFHFKIINKASEIIFGLILFYFFIHVLPNFFNPLQIITLLLISITSQLGKLIKKF